MADFINTPRPRDSDTDTSGPALLYGTLIVLAIVILFALFVIPSLRIQNTPATPVPSQAPSIQSVPQGTPRIQEIPLDKSNGQPSQQNQFRIRTSPEQNKDQSQPNKTPSPSY